MNPNERPGTLTRAQLLEHAGQLGIRDPVCTPDKKQSVGTKVIRCGVNGQRAVAVGADAGTEVQITALLDCTCTCT